MVFSFADEWWKYSGGNWSEHDTQASWQNGNYVDPHMNEEWWGLVDVHRQPRQAFTVYGQLTAPTP